MRTAVREKARLRSPLRLRPRASTPADVAKRRVQASLLVLLLLLAAALAAGVLSAFGLYRSAEARYVHVVFPLRAAVRDLSFGVVEEENGMRGYVITGNRRSLAPYVAGRKAVEADLAQIARLTRGRPQLRSRLDEMRRELRPLHGYYARLLALIAAGRVGKREARTEVLANEPLLARFNQTARRMQNDIDSLLERTRVSQRATFYRSVGILVVTGFLGLAIATTLLVSVPGRLRELYLAEEQARQRAESGANAARALEHVSDAVVLVDDEGRIRSWNAAAERHFGVALGLALGRRAVEVIPEYERLAAAADVVRVEVGGEERWFAATRSVFEGGHVLTARDVTEAQALEQARTEFVATASHELRTPLTSIYGAAQTLLGRSDLPEPRRLELLRVIEQESTQLARIVEQLLLSARLTRGTLEYDPAPCDVRAVCERVLAAAEARKPAHTTLALAAPVAVPPLLCDEGLLRQVLANLVDNALKYSPNGGRIELRLTDAPDRLRIEVRDEGLGIPHSEQERIFERFYRLDADMTRGVGGSGLGLHIARELVLRMGGTIGVESTPGEGSTFTVTLPRLAQA